MAGSLLAAHPVPWIHPMSWRAAYNVREGSGTPSGGWSQIPLGSGPKETSALDRCHEPRLPTDPATNAQQRAHQARLR